jgi:hypothetical protein
MASPRRDLRRRALSPVLVIELCSSRECRNQVRCRPLTVVSHVCSSRVIFACLLALLLVPATARASISPVVGIDGPSPDIVGFGGSAMASDGTGGVVYRKRVNGVAHIFAAQFDGSKWLPPQRVDNGQPFESSWPVIAAGDGGRLVVAWVQEFGPSSDRLYSAGIDPGAKRFQAPVPIDLNVGVSTGTNPSIAMNDSGQAYISYLVMDDPTSADLPGYAHGELRVARYDGTYWSGVGFPLNRNTFLPLPIPVAGATPQVTIDITGNGILAWIEPDDNFVNRVWARRLFGLNVGVPLEVSPATWSNAPLPAPADAFSLDGAGFGEGAIAFRQQPSPNGPLNGAHIMLATTPETSSPDAGTFGAPRIVDGAAPNGPGVPSVGVDRIGDATTVFGFAQRTFLAGSDDKTVDPPERIDDGRTTVPGSPEVDAGVSGATVAAWKIKLGGAGGLGVTERRADGVPTAQEVTAPTPGVVNTFALAGSGLGDAIVGWDQGPDSGRQIAALVVDAPPDPFAVNTPVDWVRTPPTLEWDMPDHAIGGVRFAVTVDDQTVADNLTGTSRKLRSRDVDDGVSVIQVVAEDAGGQETTSYPSDLKLDSRPPKAGVRRYGNGLVVVRLSDGPKSSTSGVDATSVKVSWGDGKSSSGHLTLQHRYGGGTHTITITAADKAGNKLKRKVKV